MSIINSDSNKVKITNSNQSHESFTEEIEEYGKHRSFENLIKLANWKRGENKGPRHYEMRSCTFF